MPYIQHARIYRHHLQNRSIGQKRASWPIFVMKIFIPPDFCCCRWKRMERYCVRTAVLKIRCAGIQSARSIIQGHENPGICAIVAGKSSPSRLRKDAAKECGYGRNTSSESYYRGGGDFVTERNVSVSISISGSAGAVI